MFFLLAFGFGSRLSENTDDLCCEITKNCKNKFIEKPSFDKKNFCRVPFFVDLLERELQVMACQNFIFFSVGRGGGGVPLLR